MSILFYQKNKTAIALFFCLAIVAVWSGYIVLSSSVSVSSEPLSPPVISSNEIDPSSLSAMEEEPRLPSRENLQNSPVPPAKQAASVPADPAPPTSPVAQIETPSTVPVTLTIENNTYAADVTEQSSVFSLMRLLSDTHPEFTFSGREYGALGFFVETINGVSNNTKTKFYWTLYVNGTRSNLGVSSAIIQPSDSITWKYEKD